MYPPPVLSLTLFGLFLFVASPALAQPDPCGVPAGLGNPSGDCFAVFVVPDTQNYVEKSRNETDQTYQHGTAQFQDQGFIHLKRVMQWIRENRTGWVEPETGVSMNIELVIQLGDLVNGGNAHLDQWEKLHEAFCILDDCSPAGPIVEPIRYLAIPGNHDWDGELNVTNRSSSGSYRALETTHCYTRFFGEDGTCSQLAGTMGDAGSCEPGVPMQQFSCESEERTFDELRCTGLNIETDCGTGWYLGGGGNTDFEAPDPLNPTEFLGNRIPEASRMNAADLGPASDQAGRYRAGVIQAPLSGQHFLFAGLEFSDGIPHSSQWLEELLSQNPSIPTLLFNHEGLAIDSPLVANHPQVYMTLAGHEFSSADRAHSLPLATPKAVRNYQGLSSTLAPEVNGYGAGINLIAVVDPVRGEIRMQPYQIDGASSVANSEPVTIQSCNPQQGVPSVDCQNPIVANYRNQFPICALSGDTDADAYFDACDNCPEHFNPLQENTDGVGQGDACNADQDFDEWDDGGADNCEFIFNPGQEDNDADGIGDACDICPTTPDPNQEDADSDGIGDACNQIFDTDGDEIANVFDACPWIASATSPDTDGDGLPDVCDNCLGSNTCSFPDADGDSLADFLDNCPDAPNRNQANIDGDAVGDACDPDDDQDGVLDSVDNCPTIANGPLAGPSNQLDEDGDSVGDACDNCLGLANTAQYDADYDGYGNACDCDLNNNGLCWVHDWAPFASAFSGPNPVDSSNAYADFDNSAHESKSDGVVGGHDYSVFTLLFGSEGPSSGLACAGTLEAQSGVTPCVPPEHFQDDDLDLVINVMDNCRLVANGPNQGLANQFDSNGDGIGNQCDCDYTNDGVCGGPDYSVFVMAFGGTYDPDVDANGDGIIGGPDFSAFAMGFGDPSLLQSGYQCIPDESLHGPLCIPFLAPGLPEAGSQGLGGGSTNNNALFAQSVPALGNTMTVLLVLLLIHLGRRRA